MNPRCEQFLIVLAPRSRSRSVWLANLSPLFTMTSLPILPDDVLQLIARHMVQDDMGDRMWATVTRLLRSQRGLLPWQLAIRGMTRPLTLQFRIPPVMDGSVGVIGLFWFWQRSLPRLVTFSIHGPTASRTLNMMATTEGESFYMLCVKDLVDNGMAHAGIYTVHVTWDRALEVSTLDFTPAFFEHTRMTIASFGNQNLTSLECIGVDYSKVHWPPVLPRTVRSLKNFAHHARDFDCRNIQYWDIRNVTDMWCFMWNTPGFSGDLSRLTIRPYCVTTGAFIGTGAIAVPAGFEHLARTRPPWERFALRFPLLWMSLPLCILILCSMGLIWICWAAGHIGLSVLPLLGVATPTYFKAKDVLNASHKNRACCIGHQ